MCDGRLCPDPDNCDREDGDTYDEDRTKAPGIRQWLMSKVRRRAAQGDPLSAQLIDLEYEAESQGLFLGWDHDCDLSDLEAEETLF